MATIEEIEGFTKRYADARAVLTGRVQSLTDELTAVKRRKMNGIKSAIAAAAMAHNELRQAVDDNRGLFGRPKTQIFHGIRVGIKKGTGKVSFPDAEKVCARIESQLPDQVDTLIAVKRTPVKSALQQLSAAVLKKLGVTVQETGESVYIKPTDSDVDKVVDALLKDAQEDDTDGD